MGKKDLTPWLPGQSGNPNGRPKGSRNRATILAELLALPADTHENQEYKMIQALIDKAHTGDVTAIKEAQDTMYGKMTDKIETKQEVKLKSIKSEVLKKLSTQDLEDIVATANLKLTKSEDQ